MTHRKTLRRALQHQRCHLSPHQQLSLSKLISQHLAKSLLFLRSKRIAFYFAQKGEVSTQILLEKALNASKECFFPALHPLKNNQLLFRRFEPGEPLSINKFGILEPTLPTNNTPIWSLDLILMPLVGFDLQGNRLGMGGGFYDQTFELRHNWGRQPILIGLAYDFQCLDCIASEAWDVPMDGVVTEKEIYQFD